MTAPTLLLTQPTLTFDLSDPALLDEAHYSWLSAAARGPYGEIYPPPLDGNESPENMLAAMAERSQQLGAAIHVPKKAEARKRLAGDAIQIRHNQRLVCVARGEFANEEEAALYVAVFIRREPLSLRPLPPALKRLTYSRFVPVMQRLDETNWRLGVKQYAGVVAIEESDPGVAIQRLLALRYQMAAEDEKLFDTEIDRALATMPPLLFLDMWLAKLHAERSLPISGDYSLARLGSHTVTLLDTPSGSRLLDTELSRAVRAAVAMARWAGAPLAYPTAAEVMAWLDSIQAPPTPPVEWHATGAGGLPARWTDTQSGRQYVLVARGEKLVCNRVKDGGGFETTNAETAMDEPVATWLQAGDAAGRAALARWALWKATAVK